MQANHPSGTHWFVFFPSPHLTHKATFYSTLPPMIMEVEHGPLKDELPLKYCRVIFHSNHDDGRKGISPTNQPKQQKKNHLKASVDLPSRSLRPHHLLLGHPYPWKKTAWCVPVAPEMCHRVVAWVEVMKDDYICFWILISGWFFQVALGWTETSNAAFFGRALWLLRILCW